MKTTFSHLRATRTNIIKICERYSIEQLNTIPQGFNNNLIWNFGHVIATQQLLVYGLAGRPLNIDADVVERFRKGTKPEGAVLQSEYDLFKHLSAELVDQCETDLANDFFEGYKEYTTSYGVTLKSVEEAIAFNNSHEALHLGSMLAIEKFL